jgi:peroxiredoxin Q/BCP
MTSAETTVTTLKEGDTAPKFKLAAYPSGQIALEDYLGKKNVVLAFYPKDDTPGCTKEMCAFTEDLSHFEQSGTEVLGISCDNVASHEKFAGKYSLKQPLLADADGTVGKLYGAVQTGKTTAARKLFVIDKQGVIRHIHDGMPTNESLLAIVKGLK